MKRFSKVQTGDASRMKIGKMQTSDTETFPKSNMKNRALVREELDKKIQAIEKAIGGQILTQENLAAAVGLPPTTKAVEMVSDLSLTEGFTADYEFE